MYKKKPGPPALTQRQTRFCKEYLVDKNATQAAIRSGYSPRYAAWLGHRTLRKPYIRDYIDRQLAKQYQRMDLTADKVIKEIAKLAFVDITQIFDEDGNLKAIKDLSPDAAASVASVEVVRQVTGKDEDPEFIHKVKLWDKTRALELLAKHFNLLGDAEKDKGDTYITNIINSFNIEDKPAVDAALTILEDNMRVKKHASPNH